MKELTDLELENVAGGRYYINVNTGALVFTSTNQVYNLKCSAYQAMEVMDSLVGVYGTEAEYDQACVDLLTSNGWI